MVDTRLITGQLYGHIDGARLARLQIQYKCSHGNDQFPVISPGNRIRHDTDYRFSR